MHVYMACEINPNGQGGGGCYSTQSTPLNPPLRSTKSGRSLSVTSSNQLLTDLRKLGESLGAIERFPILKHQMIIKILGYDTYSTNNYSITAIAKQQLVMH